MPELQGCGCGGGGQELTATKTKKVSTGDMTKPATGNKTGKAPKESDKGAVQGELQK